jgi:membrane protein
MFEVGKFAIGLYIGNSGAASSFGAAGSLIALLLWVYYSAQIFFLGAEFARQYAIQLGSLKHKAAAVVNAQGWGGAQERRKGERRRTESTNRRSMRTPDRRAMRSAGHKTA